jgi:hypothetical protein
MWKWLFGEGQKQVEGAANEAGDVVGGIVESIVRDFSEKDGDLVHHYYHGEGFSYDLSEHGELIEGAFAGSIGGKKARVVSAAFEEAGLSCDGKTSATVSGSMRASADLTGIFFSLGHSAVKIKWKCQVSIACDTCCDGTVFPVSRAHWCSWEFDLSDRFADPADIFDLIPGEMEMVGGKPFDLNYSWVGASFGGIQELPIPCDY